MILEQELHHNYLNLDKKQQEDPPGDLQEILRGRVQVTFLNLENVEQILMQATYLAEKRPNLENFPSQCFWESQRKDVVLILCEEKYPWLTILSGSVEEL